MNSTVEHKGSRPFPAILAKGRCELCLAFGLVNKSRHSRQFAGINSQHAGERIESRRRIGFGKMHAFGSADALRLQHRVDIFAFGLGAWRRWRGEHVNNVVVRR
jgi:hypothetical protein